MSGSVAHESSKPDWKPCSGADEGARRRRAAVAFLTGAALFVVSAAAMLSGRAFASGPAAAALASFGSHFQLRLESADDPHFIEIPLAPPPARRLNRPRHVEATIPAASFGPARQVCVRLCDGAFFPAGAAVNSGDQAPCASLCPGAPTALYSIPAGSDRIEDAISARGERYSALPAALRYRSTRDKTCACHRAVADDFSPLQDSTLRKGDAVMTERGFVVFQGAEQPTHRLEDFAALTAAALPSDQRVALQELERGNAAPLRGVTRSWALAQGPSWSVKPTHSTIASISASPRSTLVVSNRNEIRFVEAPLPSTN